MPIVSLDSNDSLPLIDQIANAVKKMIDDRAIRAGTRMPSIRNFAHDHGISRFTVVQAYDRLVAMGYLQSRQGSGFYVSQRQNPYVAMENSYEPDSVMDIVWLLRNSLEHRSSSTMPGAWWLPAAWMEETGIKKSLRTLSLKDGEFMTAYGTPSGYLPLRELLSNKLSGIGIAAGASQIVLTSGVTHAMDLIARYFIRAGDAVLVDDPGYFILFGGLKSFGAKIVGVPWNVDGPDTHAMEELIKEHHPKIFFTNTILHNPTGASISQAVAYRMLQLAEKYDMMLVEDDIYGDFHPATLTRLATLDQLNRVIYVSSFSKTVSASLRVGYFACSPELAASLCDVKLLTGLTTSEISERLMYQLLTEGTIENTSTSSGRNFCWQGRPPFPDWRDWASRCIANPMAACSSGQRWMTNAILLKSQASQPKKGSCSPPDTCSSRTRNLPPGSGSTSRTAMTTPLSNSYQAACKNNLNRSVGRTPDRTHTSTRHQRHKITAIN